jgi:hypothetical protein
MAPAIAVFALAVLSCRNIQIERNFSRGLAMCAGMLVDATW